MRCPPAALCAFAVLLQPLPLSAEGPAATPAPPPPGAPAATPLPQGRFEMRCENGRISVVSNEADTAQMLMEFSKKSGVTFNKFVGKTQNATLDLKDAPFEDFLGRVLSSYVTKAKRVDGRVVVSSVTVMDEGPESAPPPDQPPPVGPGRLDRPGRPEDSQAREDALKRRRRRRRRPFRGGAGQEEAEAPAPPENPPPEIAPPPEAPPPEHQPPQDQPPPDPSGDAVPGGAAPPPSDQPPPGEPPPPSE